jgi:hypothetical protein
MSSVTPSPPDPTTAAAVSLTTILTVSDETDETGRLLLEDSAPERAVRLARRRGVEMRFAPCPYEDTPSRLGRPMNTAAYEALRADLGDVLDGFAWLAERTMAQGTSQPGTPGALYEVSYLGISLPTLLLHRAADPYPPHGALPTIVASTFKASRGLFSLAVSLLNDGRTTRRVDAVEAVGYADRKGNLVRPRPSRACAAPTRMIERTIAAILGQEGVRKGGTASRLEALVSFPVLWELMRVQDELSQALSTYSSVLDHLRRTSPGRRTEELFDLRVPGTSGSFGQLTDALVQHANDVQRRLNRLLGRSADTAPLGVRQVLALL